jgi:cytochrome c biogenesis protein CcdA
VLGALLIVAGIAAVDALNPGTIGPALVLAVSSKPVERILAFTVGFFAVNLAGGILLVLGPGKWLLSLFPSVSPRATHILEVAGGVALLVAAALLLAFHRRLVGRERGAAGPEVRVGSGSGAPFVAGAGLALAELPTAFPYFAAIAAIDAASVSLPSEILLLVVFNLIFLSPLIAIGIGLALFPSLRESFIEPFRRWMSLHWPHVLAGILSVAGVVLIALGLAGLSSHSG